MDETQALKDPFIGLWILDQYEVVELIGQGGMGLVYLAKQPSIDRHAAIKFLHKNTSDEHRARFRREARTASRLSHPNIVTIYNFGELPDGTPFLAMEHVQGIALDQLMKAGAMPVSQALDIAYQSAVALAHAHNNKLIHRDFKPANVIISQLSGRDHVKVLDFGLARTIDEADAGQSGSLTRAGVIMGTPEYLSPESCLGLPASEMGDQYALGLVLYQMLSGRSAITAPSPIAYIHAHVHGDPEPLGQARPDLNLEVVEPIVMRMIAKDPAKRFPTMDDVHLALRDVADRAYGGPLRESISHPSFEHITMGDSSLGGATQTMETPYAASLPEYAAAVGAPRVIVAGPLEVLDQTQHQALASHGVEAGPRVSRPAELAGVAGSSAGLLALGLAPAGWEAAWEQWRAAGATPESTLLCLDASTDTPELAGAVGAVNHVLLGPLPADPLVLGIVTQWLRGGGATVLDAIPGAGALQTLRIANSAQKSFYVDSLMDDVSAHGLRAPVRQALNELSEELIMNAIFHAPVDDEGKPRNRELDRRAAVMLPPGHEASMQWVVGDEYVGLAVRDPFGSASAEGILNSMTSAASPPQTTAKRQGAGLGLRIMSRAARHLILSLSPRSWFEVLALVDRNPSAASKRRRSISFLQFPQEQEQQIGDRLWYSARPSKVGIEIRLRGDINETSDLGPIFGRSGRVLLELGEVASVNSMGIYAWTHAYQQRHGDQVLVLANCSIAVVNQFNLLPDLVAGAEVRSVHAPYYCASCDRESNETLQLGEIEDLEPPARNCPQCGRELEFGELPEEYFAFLED